MGRQSRGTMSECCCRTWATLKTEAECIMGGGVWQELAVSESPPSAKNTPAGGSGTWTRHSPLPAGRTGARSDTAPSALGFGVRPHWHRTVAGPSPTSRGTNKANIKTGADLADMGGSAPSAILSSRLPHLFLWGNENSGKSILHEALSLLVTKGIAKADKALTNNNDFNGELQARSSAWWKRRTSRLTPGAHARIKEWVTARNLSIRRMLTTDAYTIPNTTHWIQVANTQTACPVIPGRYAHHGHRSQRPPAGAGNPQKETLGKAGGGSPAVHVHLDEPAASAVDWPLAAAGGGHSQ